MMSDQYETPHIPQTLRGDTIWETKLDQGNTAPSGGVRINM